MSTCKAVHGSQNHMHSHWLCRDGGRCKASVAIAVVRQYRIQLIIGSRVKSDVQQRCGQVYLQHSGYEEGLQSEHPTWTPALASTQHNPHKKLAQPKEGPYA